MIYAHTVLAIHDAILATEPGLHGGHGAGPLEGALGRIASAIDYDGLDDVYVIAALYAVAIARGHVFNDANKRTALVTALTYLATQGIEVRRSAALEEIMVDVAQGELDHKDLGELLYSIASWSPYADEKTKLSLETVAGMQSLLDEVSVALEAQGAQAEPGSIHQKMEDVALLCRSVRRNFEKSRWAAAGAQGGFSEWLQAAGLQSLIAP
ncbi:type II toxin-antitoxin system death-on-curing family toxin [Comamonas sediminis]|uniref:type II toxin-antitoxin system death-on-curing family toxin n=1 Tax=Comamonas sediminis TaxID=1783360 RepID=UPI003D2D3B83